MEVPAVWDGQQVNASDILDALRKHHKGAALVHEVVVTDPWAQSNHISGTGRTNHSRRIDALMVESLQLTAIEIKISKADLARRPGLRLCLGGESPIGMCMRYQQG